jgi:uncharacterized membrane protein YkvA (DUF1232 family)
VAGRARKARETQSGRGAGRRRSRVGLRRLLGWLAFLPIASRAPAYGRLIAALVRDERIPLARKGLLAAALGYLVLGRDIVPDELPVLGGIDDLVVVVLAVDLFLEGVPDELLAEKLGELGIDRRAFEADVARIRRLTPGPIRRTLHRVPDGIATAGAMVQQSGLGPKIRAWIDKEGSTA